MVPQARFQSFRLKLNLGHVRHHEGTLVCLIGREPIGYLLDSINWAGTLIREA